MSRSVNEAVARLKAEMEPFRGTKVSYAFAYRMMDKMDEMERVEPGMVDALAKEDVVVLSDLARNRVKRRGTK